MRFGSGFYQESQVAFSCSKSTMETTQQCAKTVWTDFTHSPAITCSKLTVETLEQGVI